MKRVLHIVVLTCFFLGTHLGASAIMAVTIPTFPSCLNPQGITQASYSSGTHGIAGNMGIYNGSDFVYRLSDTTLMQCFCSDTGSGIQSNWWNVSGLTESEIQVLRNQGWVYITTGAVWGLSDSPYMVKNTDYACNGGVGGAAVLSASTSQGEVLALASTGNTVFVVSVGLAALFVSAIGIVLWKSEK